MPERLSARAYDELAEGIWAFAKVAIPRSIQIAPPPCLVTGEITVDEQLVELGVEVTKSDQHVATELPRRLQMALGHVEPYALDPDYQLWSYEMLTLMPSRRERTFQKGHQIFSERHGVLLQPNTSALPSGVNRRLGSLAWREIKTATSFTDFGPGDAERFRVEAERLALRVRDID